MDTFVNALYRGEDAAKALDHPFVKSGLEAMRAQARNSSATPGPSSRLPKVEGKSWSDLDAKGRKENFPKMSEAAKAGR